MKDKSLIRNVVMLLVSDQPVSNLLFCRNLDLEIDEVVLFTTTKMERSGVTDNLINVLNLTCEIKRIVISNTDYLDAYSLLSEIKSDGQRLLVNLTGGNKIMAMAVYDAFRDHEGCRFYYSPVGGDLFTCFNDPDASFSIRRNLNVSEYLNSYGIGFNHSENCIANFKEAEMIMRLHQKYKFNRRRVLSYLESNKSDYLEFKKYYEGGWFEEYLYYSIKKHLNLGDDEIYLDVELIADQETGRVVNELDVAFVYKSDLYIIEAKANVTSRGVYNINPLESSRPKVSVADDKPLGQYLYKLAAVNKLLGIRTQCVLATLTDLRSGGEDFNGTLQDRMKILDIHHLIDRYEFINDENFSKRINYLVKNF